MKRSLGGLSRRRRMMCGLVLVGGVALGHGSAWASESALEVGSAPALAESAQTAVTPSPSSDASQLVAATEPAPPSAIDPFERFNRGVFLFNGVLDHFIIKPVAEGYEAVVPKPVRSSVGNALGNVSDAWSALNLALQGKGTRAAEMTVRVGINTILGLGGLMDVATEVGFERQSEDMGQTLATWGVPSGPYVVLPFFGPSTLRDAAAFPLDMAYSSAVYPSREPQRWGWLGLRLTDARTDALPFTRMLDTIALDKYTFVRDAWLSRRRNLVYDGNPPPEDERL